MKFKHKKGSNTISITFNERIEGNKIKNIQKDPKFKQLLNSMIYKRDKIPRKMIIKTKGGYSKSTVRRAEKNKDIILPEYYVTNKFSETGVKVTPKTATNFIGNYIDEYEDELEETARLGKSPFPETAFDHARVREIQFIIGYPKQS